MNNLASAWFDLKSWAREKRDGDSPIDAEMLLDAMEELEREHS